MSEDELIQSLEIQADASQLEKVRLTMAKYNIAVSNIVGGHIRFDETGDEVAITVRRIDEAGNKMNQTWAKSGNIFKLTSESIAQADNAYKNIQKTIKDNNALEKEYYNNIIKSRKSAEKATDIANKRFDKEDKNATRESVQTDKNFRSFDSASAKVNLAIEKGYYKEIAQARKLTYNSISADDKSFRAYERFAAKQNADIEKGYYKEISQVRKTENKSIQDEIKAFAAFDKFKASQGSNVSFVSKIAGRFGGGGGFGDDSTLKLASANLLASATVKAISLTRDAYEEAVKYTRSLSQLQIASHGAAGGLGNLADHISTLSKSFNISTEEVVAANLIILKTQLGDTAKSALILNEALKLSKITFSSLPDAAETLTTAINAFGISEKDFAKVSAILFQTVQSGTYTMEQLKDTFGQVNGIAQPLGVKIDEVAQALAGMTRLGIPAGAASTDLINILLRLHNLTPELAKDLKLGFGADTGKEFISRVGGLLPALKELEAYAKAHSGSSLAGLFATNRSGRVELETAGELYKTIAAGANEFANAEKNAADALKTVTENVGEQADKIKNNLITSMKEAGAEALIFWSNLFNGKPQAGDPFEKLTGDAKQLQILLAEKSSIPINPQDLRAARGDTDNLTDSISERSPRTTFAKRYIELENQIEAIRNKMKVEEEAAIQIKKIEEGKKKQYEDSYHVFQDKLGTAKVEYQRYTQRIIELEDEKSKKIRSDIDVNLRREEDAVKKLQSLAEHAGQIKKASAERAQSIQDQVEDKNYKRALDLANPAQTEQLHQRRTQDLKDKIENKVSSLATLTPDQFLSSKAPEEAANAAKQLTEAEEDKYSKVVEQYKLGKATENDVLQQKYKINEAIQRQLDVEQQIQDAAEAREQSAKKEADAAQKKLDVTKELVIEASKFSFDDKKFGNKKQALEAFDNLVTNAKKSGASTETLALLGQRRGIVENQADRFEKDVQIKNESSAVIAKNEELEKKGFAGKNTGQSTVEIGQAIYKIINEIQVPSTAPSKEVAKAMYDLGGATGYLTTIFVDLAKLSGTYKSTSDLEKTLHNSPTSVGFGNSISRVYSEGQSKSIVNGAASSVLNIATFNMNVDKAADADSVDKIAASVQRGIRQGKINIKAWDQDQ